MPRSLPDERPSERLVVLEGGCNFRDIGGYPAHEGASVRWGKVYRAGVLSYFSGNDREALSRLGVRAICDLRRSEERRREPTRWPDPEARSFCWDDEQSIPTIRAFAARRAPTAAGMREAMIDLYRALPAWMAGRIRGLFECVAGGHVPLVVHCAAGKDRTGVAVAVLLLALGVPREVVIDDYLLTNQAGNFEDFIRTREDSGLGLATEHHPLLATPQDIRRVLLNADADYLEAALHQVGTSYGSVEGYLDAAGVDEALRRRVREQLLS